MCLVCYSGLGVLLYLDEDSGRATVLNSLLLFLRPLLLFAGLAFPWMQRWKTLVLWVAGHVCFQAYYSSTRTTLDWGA